MPIPKYIKWFLNEYSQKTVTISCIRSLALGTPVHFDSTYISYNIPKWPDLMTSTLSWYRGLAVFTSCCPILEQRTGHNTKTAEGLLEPVRATCTLKLVFFSHPYAILWSSLKLLLRLPVSWRSVLRVPLWRKVFIHGYAVIGILILSYNVLTWSNCAQYVNLNPKQNC